MFSRSGLLIAICILALLALSACGTRELAEVAPPTVGIPGAQASPTAVAPREPTVLPTPPLATASPMVEPTAVTVPTVVAIPSRVPTPSATPTETVKPAAVFTPTPVPTLTPPEPTPLPSPTPTAVPEPTPSTNGKTPHGDEVSLTETEEKLTSVEVVKVLRPSVVHIATQSLSMGFFNQPVPETGVGTGVVLDEKGTILTNNHVVEGVEHITVTLSNGESFPATLVGSDRQTDIAVIKIEGADGLQPAVLGDSSATEVGEDVIAIGHALGLPGGPTVSKGVVSALGRSIETDPEARIVIVDLIQTDASINPGNSGGPLVNDRAEIIGINSAMISESQGIGFAININDAKTVAGQLIERGFVLRGVLGIIPDNVTPVVASQRDFPVSQGIWVESVAQDSAAQAAGLRAGDIIVQLGDKPIANTGELSNFLIDHPPGETVDVVFYRDQDRVTTTLTLGEP